MKTVDTNYHKTIYHVSFHLYAISAVRCLSFKSLRFVHCDILVDKIVHLFVHICAQLSANSTTVASHQENYKNYYGDGDENDVSPRSRRIYWF